MVVDHTRVQALEMSLVDADHCEVASSVASYVLEFMSEHEKKFVKSELTSLEEYPSNSMKSCVIQIIISILENAEQAECKCFEDMNRQNNRETRRKKSKPSAADVLQICFIHG